MTFIKKILLVSTLQSAEPPKSLLVTHKAFSERSLHTSHQWTCSLKEWSGLLALVLPITFVLTYLKCIADVLNKHIFTQIVVKHWPYLYWNDICEKKCQKANYRILFYLSLTHAPCLIGIWNCTKTKGKYIHVYSVKIDFKPRPLT